MREGDLVRVVRSPHRLRGNGFVGKIGRIKSGPVQFVNGMVWTLAFPYDQFDRYMFDDEIEAVEEGCGG
jgi:hypothetical protein